HTGAGEDHLLAGSQIFGGVNALWIFYAHAREAFVMLGFADDEAGENLAIEAAQRGGSKHSFRSAARAHDHVHAGAEDGGGNAGGEVAVTDEPDARASRADFLDEFFVAGAIENDDHEIFDVAIEAIGDGA